MKFRDDLISQLLRRTKQASSLGLFCAEGFVSGPHWQSCTLIHTILVWRYLFFDDFDECIAGTHRLVVAAAPCPDALFQAPSDHILVFGGVLFVFFFCRWQMEDNKRSIPCLVDGFKPSQRKVLFSCFKRNLKKEIKVSRSQALGSSYLKRGIK